MGRQTRVTFLVLIAIFLFYSNKGFATIDSWPGSFNGAMVANPTTAVFSVLDLNYSGNTTLQTVNSVSNAVSLRVVDGAYITGSFSCKLTLKIDCYADPGSSTIAATYTPVLSVTYNKTQGLTYQGVSAYNFANAYKIVVYVTNVAVVNAGDALPQTGAVQLTGNITVDRSYTFQPHAALPLGSTGINTTTRQLPLSWNFTPGDEEYDLEWTTIDIGDPNENIASALATNSTNTTLTSQAALLFKNNASRITTHAHTDTIALTFNDDYLVTRIRRVHYSPTTGIRMLGDWFYNLGSAFSAWSISANWHVSNFNWQYSAAYAEDGKKKEVISYFDGTLRSRQTVTVNNSDRVAAVQENIFDLFGRPVASILPAPVKVGGVNVPYLHYFSNLNLNSASQPYSYADIVTTGCEPVPGVLNTSSGTSKYYSSQNDFVTDNNFTKNTNNYIPDAQKYPLSVTQYTADNTGRINLQGGVGQAFQPGLSSPSHTTKYIYGKPEQWELDQLFGNDVGYAEHYMKNVVIDPNNQMSISYLNASGKTIATALAGVAPANMDSLVSIVPKKFKTSHILKPNQFVFDNSSLKLAATTTYPVTVTGPDTIKLDIQQLIYTYSTGTTKICSNCYYDLNFKVFNSCAPTVPINTGNTTFAVGSTIANCTPSSSFTKSIPLNFTSVGEYYIVCEFTLSRTVMESYLDQFIAQGQGYGLISKEWSFVFPYLDKIDFSGVLADCTTAVQTLGTKTAFTQMFSTKLASLDVDLSKLSHADSVSYNSWVSAKYDNLSAIAHATCNLSPCNDIQTLMQQDISPGGQYSLFDSNNATLEGNINVIANNWRVAFPVLSATDPVYQLNGITRSDGTFFYPNDATAVLTDIVKYWNPSWATYFLQFHPEYCKLQFCMNNSNAKDWDEHVKQFALKATDIPAIPSAPVGFHYDYNNASWLLAIDPFFSGAGATYYTAMQQDLNSYSTRILNSTSSTKSLTQYIDYSLYCAGNCKGSDTPTNNCWDNCSAVSCRVADRDWAAYKSYYFQLKENYYNQLRNSTTCANNCTIGQLYTASSPGATCAGMNDFSLSATAESDFSLVATCLSDTTKQSVTVTCTAGKVTSTTYVYFYYPPGAPAGLPASATVAAGQSKAFLCLPKSLPVSDIEIKAVNCTGSAPAVYVPVTPTAPGATIQRLSLSTFDCGYGSTDFYVSAVNNNYFDAVSGHTGLLVTVKVKPNIIVCRRKTMQAEVNLRIDGASSFVMNIDSNSYTGTAFINLSNNTALMDVYGVVSACKLPLLANNGCAEAYNYKTSRFDVVSNINSFPTNKDTLNTQNLALVTKAIVTSCEGNADRWMALLTPGITAYTPTIPPANIPTLKANLIKFCEDNGDITHPDGASTTIKTGAANLDAPATSFGDVIKSSLGISAFSDMLNPWILDGPAPYSTPVQAANLSISNSTKAISDTLTQLNTRYVASHYSGTFYQYLVATFGSAMTLSQSDLTALQNASAACNYILTQDVTLPVFMQTGSKGCISVSDYSAAKSALLAQFPTLTSSFAHYSIILTNFMNQKFGFALGYSAWLKYDAAPTGLLCNSVPYVPLVTDPFSPIEDQIGVEAANGKRDYAAYIKAQKDLFRTNYVNTCAAAQANVYNTAQMQNYHFTLYYYDQADNLIRTIPPEGVHVLSDAQIALVQQIRDGADAGSCGTAYTGPTTSTPAQITSAFTAMGALLGSGTNSAMEFWFYNTTNSGNQFSQVTPDGQYRVQLSINGTALGVDIYSSPSFGSFANLNRVTVGLSQIPPLQTWTHVVIQSNNLLTGELSIYVNGNKVPVINNSLPVSYAGNLTTIKHLRLYNRFLNPAEIAINASNNCFMPFNTDYGTNWYRFNIPLQGSETTVGANSTQETNLTGIYPTHTLATSYAYNSTNQVSQQNSPDAGNSSFWYDYLSRLVISQNDKQLAAANFSYTTFDKLGRISEVGQKNITNSGLSAPDYLYDGLVQTFNSSGINSQITHTYYDTINTSGILGLQKLLLQNNLRKRVVASTYSDTQAGPIQQATYYNYDLDGNVSTLWQQINGLDTKQIDYEYDLISGKVNFVRYQAGKTDQFFYKYLYDADNRLTEAWTGTMALIKTYGGSDLLAENRRMDAHYDYYLHGPLKRLELGDVNGKVQGLDYVYTLQGWLKGVNNQNTTLTTDVGQDALAGTNSTIAKDAFGYSIGYYSGDYAPIVPAGSTAFGLQYTSAAGDITGQGLYNGNISNTILSLSQINTGTPVGYTYHYDQLNRLKVMRQHAAISGTSWDKTSMIADYGENVTYDGNGNILSYIRKGTGTSLQMDRLAYLYNRSSNGWLLNNQLQYIKDTVATSTYAGDLTTQAAGNYTYDKIGNLTKDVTAAITNIDWSVYGKIQTIYKATGNLVYTYDASGHRVSKTLGTSTTWYVRDAQGNALGVYDNSNSTITWKEQQLYGSSRLGLWTPNLNVGTGNTSTPNAEYGIAGRKYYELNNYLGNVLTTISDKRLQPATNITPLLLPDVITAQDYYPFGMLEPGRQYTVAGNSYRYGFNGKENDNDVGKGTGNQQDYGMRIYDPRVGRFPSVDLLTSKYPELTPYQFGSNNPTSFIDLDGLEGARPQHSDPMTRIANDVNRLIEKKLQKMGVALSSMSDDQINEYINKSVAYALNHPEKIIENLDKQGREARNDGLKLLYLEVTSQHRKAEKQIAKIIVEYGPMFLIPEEGGIEGSLEAELFNLEKKEITALGSAQGKWKTMRDAGELSKFRVLKIDEAELKNIDFTKAPDRELFWNKFNKPFLDAAIKKGESFKLIDIPTIDMIYPKGDVSKGLNFYGREIEYLEKNGYTFKGNMMVPGKK